jgi:hypothetical protein
MILLKPDRVMMRKIDLDHYCTRKFPFFSKIKFMAAVSKPAFALLFTVSEKPLVFKKRDAKSPAQTAWL